MRQYSFTCTSKAGCGLCRAEHQLEALYQKYKDSNSTVITLMGKNADEQSPSQEDLQEWASSYGLNHPVLADPEFSEVVNYLWANPAFTGQRLPNMRFYLVEWSLKCPMFKFQRLIFCPILKVLSKLTLFGESAQCKEKKCGCLYLHS